MAQTQGVRSRVLVLTDGGDSHGHCCGVAEAEVAKQRRELCLRAVDSLGLSGQTVRFLGYKDGALPHPGQKDFETLTARLSGEFREFQPAAVFAPHPLEGWSDHEAATELTRAALRRSGCQAKLYYYCVWFWFSLPFRKAWNVEWRRARVLDIAAVADRKRAAIDIYLSGKAPCGHPWVGSLPREFLRAFEWKKELFFEADI